MPVIEGGSNFTVSGNASLYEIHGNVVIRNSTDANETKKIQSIVNLPRAQASHKDYETKKKSGPCFPGTREALLQEMMDWTTEPGESRMYVLSGLAGIGKSTVVYTLATQADELGILGASFFFSRDETDRKSAKKFFSTIAYQLCVYDETFSKAIGDVLLTECGAAATTQDPQTQLKVLILDPLQYIVQSHARPILLVVDALDECDEDDGPAIVTGLSLLVRLLPSFKVILTTRPRPLVDYLFDNHDDHKIFHLQDIEDKVVDGDIRLYLSHSFSQEQVRVRLLNPKVKWRASDADVESLVKATGRLFIIASTAVLYVLNKALGDPGARMKRLLGDIAQDRTPFHALNHFYSVIVRSAVQVDGDNDDNDDNDDILDRYQIIVGTIVVLQTPLPVTALTCFVGEEPENIYAMLRNLQSAILLGSDNIPRIYHKSFADYLTDQARCKDPRFRIDTRIRHKQIAIRCFEIMDKHLKRNILGLGDPAQFMSNEEGLKEDGITDEQLEEKIPQQLRYACVYWVNHLEIANIEDVDLMSGLEKFAGEHMLHWFEVLSLIGRLDSAHRAIRLTLTLLQPTSSDLHQLLSDALRFILKFYELINRSALHTYYSALPFTPTGSLLYRRYIKQAVHNIGGIDGGPEKWDALIANLSHEIFVRVIKFSLDSTLFFSHSERPHGTNSEGTLKIWNATTGSLKSTIPGYKFVATNDFSTIASSEDNIITFHNVNGNPKGTRIMTSSKIKRLALSSGSSRIAAGLSDGTVWLWDSGNAELIDSFDGLSVKNSQPTRVTPRCWPQLEFSPTSTRLAYSSSDGIKLRDGISGRLIADLQCGLLTPGMFEFSGDGSRIASLSNGEGLTLWNSESGELVGALRDLSDIGSSCAFAISANGFLLATAYNTQVKLWSGHNNSLVQIEALDFGSTELMAFSLDNILAVGASSRIKLYDVTTHTFVSTLPFGGRPASLAFSPDHTHLAVGGYCGNLYLWDIRGIAPSSPSSREEATRVTTLALPQDCSRLACGFEDGTVKLWATMPTKQQIASHQAHTKRVKVLGFSPDGGVFASGSVDGTTKLWNGGDGALRGTLGISYRLLSVALSNSVLVAGQWDGVVTLWDLDTLSLLHTFMESEISDDLPFAVAIAENSVIIAVGTHPNDTEYLLYPGHLSFFDVVTHKTIAIFSIPNSYMLRTMSFKFLPDNSQLVLQTYEGNFLSYNLIDKRSTIEGPALERLIQLPNISLWHGVPVWHCEEMEQHYCSALFSQHSGPVPMLRIPSDIPISTWTQGKSMIALGCKDGRIILVRLPINRFG